MRRIGMVAALLTGLWACNGEEKKTDKCGDADSCSVPWECPVGFTCDVTTGCCVEFGCTPDSCPTGTFCDGDTKACTSISDACLLSAEGCECHVLNPAGEIEAAGTPTITLPAGASYPVQAVLAVKGGSPLPGANFSFTVDNTSLFTVTGSNLVAQATAAGTATLTAEAGSVATCTASLVHLGQSPAGGNVRFYVFDDATGDPVTGAEVIADYDGSAPVNDDGAVSEVGGGVYVTTVAPTGPYTVTVFRANYNYLSVVGLPQTTQEVALPIAPRPAVKRIAGLTGKPDFTDYEKLVLGGKPKTIKFGIVSSSFQLQSLLNFDLDLLIGPIADPDGGCDQVDGNGNHPAGCYSIGIPGLVDPPIWAPLPGGVLLSLAQNPIKSHFDVVGAPGRRYAWSLGGEIEITEIAPLIRLLTGFFDCSCDATPDVCDTGCTCDSDCGLTLDFGALFNSLTPLFSAFASGVKGNLPLTDVAFADWESYISPPYAERIDAAGNFPRLDTPGYGKLPIREPLRVFTDFNVGALPPDPVFAGGDGRAMEGALILTGVDTTGYGFVPLGLAAGLDCTTNRCLDRAGAGAADYDGQINGGLVCLYDPQPELNGCPPGVPTSALPTGHMGLFHAKAHTGLQGQPWVTILVALPITSLAEEGADIRAVAKILRSEPTTGASAALAGAYPTFPARAAQQTARQYQVSASTDGDVHWVTVATGEDDVTGLTTRWNIYYPATGGTFVAPVPAGGLADPFDPATNGVDETNQDKINATHIAFSADGATLADLAANNGSVLGTLLDQVDGFTVQSGDVQVAP